MLTALWFRLRYWPFFRSPSGTRQLAEQALSSLMQRLTRDVQALKKSIGQRRTRAREALQQIRQQQEIVSVLGAPGAPTTPPFAPEEQEELGRRVTFNLRATVFIAAVEGILNYVSAVIVLPGEGPVFEFFRWVVGIAFTLASILVFDKLFVAWRRADRGVTPTAVLWSVVGLATAFALYGITSARAADFEAGLGRAIYLGFVTLSLVLPVLGGWLWSDRELALPGFRRLQRWERAMGTLRELEREVEVLKEQTLEDLRRLSERFAQLVNGYWETVNFFKVLKSRDDTRRGKAPEDVAGSPAESFGRFHEEARRRYHDCLQSILSDLLRDLAPPPPSPASPGEIEAASRPPAY